MNIFKKYIQYLYKSAEAHGEHAIEKALDECKKGGILLDIGCWDGKNTLCWSDAVDASETLGIEIVLKTANKARKRGVKVFEVDANTQRWPIMSKSVDCVVSNLVIEHMSNVDHFVSESYRVLKDGGHTVVGTNNLSSWHNIVSLLFGWAPFDLANTSSKTWSIGNPLVLHKSEKLSRGHSYTHKCIYTTRWLREWYELYKFKFVKVFGSGYYPLPSFVGEIDKTHAALITLVFKK
jgi:ubiquinone/menaquinone biosynthesis C-methylase UbiE